MAGSLSLSLSHIKLILFFPQFTQCQGVPAEPQFGDLITGPRSGEIIVQIKTVAAGVNTPHQEFRFNISPVLLGIRQPERTYDFPNYVSGEFVSIVVDQLQPGASYTFGATAMNIFGNSTPANSPAQFAGIRFNIINFL